MVASGIKSVSAELPIASPPTSTMSIPNLVYESGLTSCNRSGTTLVFVLNLKRYGKAIILKPTSETKPLIIEINIKHLQVFHSCGLEMMIYVARVFCIDELLLDL